MKTFLVLSLVALMYGPANAEQTEKNRPKFKKKTITVGQKRLVVEVADKDLERAYGLMFVTKMAKNTGMLFVFDEPEMQSFWMKNTRIPLAIGYFDGESKLIEVLEMEPASILEREIKTYPSSAPAKFALEMNKGWFKKNKIESGAILKILE